MIQCRQLYMTSALNNSITDKEDFISNLILLKPFFTIIVGAAVVSRLAPGGSAQMMGVLTGTYGTIDRADFGLD